MSYRKVKKYFQNIKLYGIIGAAVIMAMSVTACSTVKNSGTEITADQTSAGATVNGIYSYDDMFTERDLDVGYDESSAVKINLADDSTTVTVGDDTEADTSETDETKADETQADESETNGTKADKSETNETKAASSGVSISGNIITISKEGTYVLSGALSEGQIVVDADLAKVQLVLDNVDITCASSAAIYIKSADKTFITLAEDSENILMNTAEYEAIDDNNIDAVIFSKDDLTLNGKGTLTINSEYGHGIVSKDDLKLVSGTCNITAKNHALSGKDSVRIAAGTYNLTSGKDGIHSENADDDEKGFVYIASGDFTIESTGDGIDASYVVQIDDGDFDITAGGGAENATKTHNDMPGGDMGGGAPGGDKPSGEAPSGSGSNGDSAGSDSGKQTGQTPPDKPDSDTFDGSRPDEKASDNADSQTSQTPPDKSGKDTSDGQQSDKNSQSKDAADSTTASDTSADIDSEAASGKSSDTDSEAASDTSSDTGSEAASSTSSDTDSTSTKGIKSDGALYVNGGSFTINSADDSFHSNSDVTINDGTYTISSGDDGMHADSALLVNGGTITVTESYEGLEGLNITINDGKIDITASDDGMNAAGGNDQSGFGGMGGDGFKGMQAPDAQKSDSASEDEMWMVINGGYVHVLAGGDGLDSNGDLTINGGEVYVDGPSDNGNSAIDYGEKSSFYINGGTVVAVGSSGMAEDVSSDSKQQVAFVKLDSQVDAGDVILKDADGNQIISYTAQKKYDCVIISTADLKAGQTYTLSASGSESEVSL